MSVTEFINQTVSRTFLIKYEILPSHFSHSVPYQVLPHQPHFQIRWDLTIPQAHPHSVYFSKNTVNAINASHAINGPCCSENQLFPLGTYLVFRTKSRNTFPAIS